MLRYLEKVWYILEGSRRALLPLVIVFVLSSILESVGIGLIGPFFKLASDPSRVLSIQPLEWVYINLKLNSENQIVLLVGLLICCIFIFKSVFYFWARSYTFRFSFSQKGKLSFKLLDAYLSVPYAFHLGRDTSGLIKNIVLEAHTFCYGCIIPLLNGISNSIVILVLTFLLLRVDITLFLIILGVLIPITLIFYGVRKVAKKWGVGLSEANHEMIRITNHSLGSVKETRILGCETHFLSQMRTAAKKFEDSAASFNSFLVLPRITLETSIVLFLVIFVSVYQFTAGANVEDLIATLSVFAIASIRMIPSASLAINSIGELQNASHAVNLLYHDLKKIEEYPRVRDWDTEGYLVFNAGRDESRAKADLKFLNEIRLQNISFSYPGSSDYSIKNVSLTIKKGESIALIGKSGAGKTTLVDIILGLLLPRQGDILVDSVSIHNEIEAWQSLIAYIPQSIFLTDETIEKNIAFGVPDQLIDHTRLNNSIEAAQLSELIEGLPQGIHTSVGERGVRLSGGQRQRIGIARALYHERDILILDEATAALDTETEKFVTQAIQDISRNKTVIVIAHRLSTIKYCDRVCLLDKGRITHVGQFEEIVPIYLKASDLP